MQLVLQSSRGVPDAGRVGIEPIVQGHYDGELHGLAISTPGGREIVSVGEDNQIAVWEMTTHRLLRRAHLSDEPATKYARPQRGATAAPTASSHPIHQCARAVAVSPNGKLITVGLNNGEIAVYTAHDLRRVFTHDLNQYSKASAPLEPSRQRAAPPLDLVHQVFALRSHRGDRHPRSGHRAAGYAR